MIPRYSQCEGPVSYLTTQTSYFSNPLFHHGRSHCGCGPGSPTLTKVAKRYQTLLHMAWRPAGRRRQKNTLLKQTYQRCNDIRLCSIDMPHRVQHYLQKPATLYLIWPLREPLFPPLVLRGMVEVCITAKWIYNVISCSFPPFACWQLIWEFQIFPQHNFPHSREAMSLKAHTDQADLGGSSQRGSVEGFAHPSPKLCPGRLRSFVKCQLG